MFKKLLAVIGVGPRPANTSVAAQAYEPYGKGDAANEIYDLLFCDHPDPLRPRPGANPADWQIVLFGPRQDPTRIRRLAEDATAESRNRALAYNWLRAHGHEVPKGIVLGVIIETARDRGLSVLAAYPDGRVRYINHTGKMAFVETGESSEFAVRAKRLVELAGPVVAQIGPWDKARLPPPQRPSIRITFVVSDGLYFGEGPLTVMQQEPRAAPLIQQGAELLTYLLKMFNQKPSA